MLTIGIIGFFLIICSIGILIEYLCYKIKQDKHWYKKPVHLILWVLSGIFQILIGITIVIVIIITYIPLGILATYKERKKRD